MRTTRNLALAISLLMLVVCFAIPASAARLVADCRQPTTNLQAILDASHNGDTVRVIGRCTGDFIIRHSCITLTGPGTLDGGGVSGGPTLGAVLQISQGCVTPHNVIENLNIINGNSTGYGGGINDISTGGRNTIRNVVLAHNQSADRGGAIALGFYGALRIINSSIVDNTAPAAGGIYNLGKLDVKDTLISHNVSSNLGGGFWNNSGGRATFDGCTFSDNQVNTTETNDGAAILNFSTLTLKDTVVEYNSTGVTTLGAAIDNTAEGSLMVESSGIIYNPSGGIHNGTESSVTLTDSYVQANTGDGGIFSYGPLTLIGTTVTDNSPFDVVK